MNWYTAKLVFRIICGEGTHTPQFDEQLRLIQADNDKEALDKALEIGGTEQYSFLNHKNQPVRWLFINVSELYKLPSLSDGAEIHSWVNETEHAGRFIDLTNRKADHLRLSVSEKTTELL